MEITIHESWINEPSISPEAYSGEPRLDNGHARIGQLTKGCVTSLDELPISREDFLAFLKIKGGDTIIKFIDLNNVEHDLIYKTKSSDDDAWYFANSLIELELNDP